jgi:uncharacterized phage protein (TIGR02220 family)
MKILQISADEKIIEEVIALLKEKFPTLNLKIQKTANETIKEIVDNLNSVCGTSFKATTKPTIAHISARLAEGYTLDDFRHVIYFKSDEWQNTEWSKFLRPETLFGNKFESYLMAAKKDIEPVSKPQYRNKKPELAL